MGHGHHDKPITHREAFALIDAMEKRIMSKISEFAAKQNEHNDKIDKAIEGISGDISFLKATIEKLQNTPGDVTADDQALLDALETRVNATTEKLAAIDDLTPPVAPTA